MCLVSSVLFFTSPDLPSAQCSWAGRSVPIRAVPLQAALFAASFGTACAADNSGVVPQLLPSVRRTVASLIV
eukprot:15052-Rhodomonas_salina.1